MLVISRAEPKNKPLPISSNCKSRPDHKSPKLGEVAIESHFYCVFLRLESDFCVFRKKTMFLFLSSSKVLFAFSLFAQTGNEAFVSNVVITNKDSDPPFFSTELNYFMCRRKLRISAISENA